MTDTERSNRTQDCVKLLFKMYHVSTVIFFVKFLPVIFTEHLKHWSESDHSASLVATILFPCFKEVIKALKY